MTVSTAGYTTLWHDHFGVGRFVVALFGIAHFVAGPFWRGPFWCEFHEIYFFCSFFNFYFSKMVKDFFVYFF